MANTGDLKSSGSKDLVGSTPTSGTICNICKRPFTKLDIFSYFYAGEIICLECGLEIKKNEPKPIEEDSK